MFKIVSLIDSLPKLRKNLQQSKRNSDASKSQKNPFSKKRLKGAKNLSGDEGMSGSGGRVDTLSSPPLASQFTHDACFAPLVVPVHLGAHCYPVGVVAYMECDGLAETVVLRSPRSSTLQRSKIRTNPWMMPKLASNKINKICGAEWAPAEAEVPQPQLVGFHDQSEKGRTTDMEDSLYSLQSSGYGSNDSSPSCSVHSPDWQPLPYVDQDETIGHEDIGLQCNMTENKCVECFEDDFLSDYGDGAYDADGSGNGDPSLATVVASAAVAKQSVLIIQELNRKLDRLKVKSDAVQRSVELVRTDRRREMKLKEIEMEQRSAIRQLRFALHCFEIVL